MIVSVTRLRLASWRRLLGFMHYTRGSLREARAAAGFLDGCLLMDRRLAFWTVTRWTDEASLRNWRMQGSHGQAMPKLAGWCDEASVARWPAADGSALPGWDECHRRMLAQGRPSPVLHPSPAHVAFTIAAPRQGRFAPALPFARSAG